MVSRNKHHGNLHLHIPKRCVAVMVGQGEEQRRFVIPVVYINHPLFMQLLKVTEEEYGFDQKGPSPSLATWRSSAMFNA
ncbi:hypothetical protein V6N13_046789 [Hibiscus sabdariffa]|uniref:Uncharacterized protein n=2 Tax=Hibiscus sabdariffa TaxID=183260 RepID=A0ABR2B8N7_9ROSI